MRSVEWMWRELYVAATVQGAPTDDILITIQNSEELKEGVLNFIRVGRGAGDFFPYFCTLFDHLYLLLPHLEKRTRHLGMPFYDGHWDQTMKKAGTQLRKALSI